VASGINNAARELGGVFGIAILASVFSSTGSYISPAAFAAGVRAAVFVGAGVVAAGAVAAALAPGRRPLKIDEEDGVLEPLPKLAEDRVPLPVPVA
jgi:hypothetical protein